jgi:hypothetical protein
MHILPQFVEKNKNIAFPVFLCFTHANNTLLTYSDSFRRMSTVPNEWIKAVRAKSPVLLEIGKKPPRCVLSFGGAGFLVTYSLGVAFYLQQEKKELVSQSFLLGAGTGCIPALALACGPQAVSLERVRDYIVNHLFNLQNEDRRRKEFEDGIAALLPANAVDLVNGRIALTIGFSNRDPGYMTQKKENIHFGHHVCTWDSRDDLVQCLIAATAPNMNQMCPFRDAPNVMRGTLMSLSSELDNYCRHVHIHGYAGYRYNKNQTRHNIFMGRHGFIANTHLPFWQQVRVAFFPQLGSGEAVKSVLLDAFEAGFKDGRRYQRWEEDPYYFAKPDHSPGDNFNVVTLRAALFGASDKSQFEL